MKHIFIIGAGAAGLMAAGTILESARDDIHVHIFEKNTSPGKKVIISGGGRCNVTTGIEDKKILETKYTRGWDFIKKSFGKFGPKKVREWFESHGVPLKIEEDMRVFPVSDDGHDIVGVFEKIFEKNRDRVTLHYGEGVSSVSFLSSSALSFLRMQESCNHSQEQDPGLRHRRDDRNVDTFNIITPKGTYTGDVLIIATGGNAYSHTGSTGDGYAFARALGHTVTELGPSLSSFLTRESWTHTLSGLAFEKARIDVLLSSGGTKDLLPKETDSSYRRNDKEEDIKGGQILTGPLLLTHFGISGPLAFMTSSRLAWDRIDKENPKVIQFAPISGMVVSDWDNFLKEAFALHPKKILINILSDKLPRRFAEAFVTEYFPHLRETFASSISRVDREKVSELLGDGIPLTLLERRPGDEFVTAGGVSTDEIDPEAMESRIHKNLYFAGEVLNVDGYTGGFSLQICWASGYVVGKSLENSEN